MYRAQALSSFSSPACNGFHLGGRKGREEIPDRYLKCPSKAQGLGFPFFALLYTSFPTFFLLLHPATQACNPNSP